MKLELKRVFVGEDYTIGHLSIDGEYFSDTLEDVPRAIKIPDQTCIPAGSYKVVINYSNRFKRSMPQLLNVPGFDGIRIHPGNDADDTSGCILVGVGSNAGHLTNSKQTYDSLFEKLLNATSPIQIVIT